MKSIAIFKGLVVSALLASTAHAHPTRVVYSDDYTEINTKYLINQPSDCVSEYITPLSQTTLPGRSCKIVTPLRLTWTYKNFPLLTQNPRNVQYWEGAVASDTVTVNKFKRELVDTCRGRIITSNTFSETQHASETFEVRNPNLDDSVHESFMLVPLTNQEAANELKEAMHRCQTN